MQKKKFCPKCKGVMETGNLSGNQVDWQLGTSHNFLKEKGTKIITYACDSCGYLESYVNKH